MYIRMPDIELPNHLNEAYISGSKYGMLIVADLKDIAPQGHVTTSWSSETTMPRNTRSAEMRRVSTALCMSGLSQRRIYQAGDWMDG